MTPLWNDLDSFLPIYNKVMALAECLKIAETDATITAGAVTSIPITALTKNILTSGSTIVLIDKTTGASHDLVLSAAAESADETLSITSHTFADDVASGSGIYFKVTDILNLLYPV